MIRGRPLLSTFKWVYKTYTFSDTLPPHQKVYTSTFFKWIICHENWLTCWKCTESMCFFHWPPTPSERVCLYTWYKADNYIWPLMRNLYFQLTCVDFHTYEMLNLLRCYQTELFTKSHPNLLAYLNRFEVKLKYYILIWNNILLINII